MARAAGGGGGAPAGPPAANAVKMGSYQQLVRGEPFRGKFRNSFEKPEPFTPNQAAKVAFEMPDVYHTFRRGHRIMIHVQSSWFPLIDRNPQTFVDIPRAKASRLPEGDPSRPPVASAPFVRHAADGHPPRRPAAAVRLSLADGFRLESPTR